LTKQPDNSDDETHLQFYSSYATKSINVYISNRSDKRSDMPQPPMCWQHA